MRSRCGRLALWGALVLVSTACNVFLTVVIVDTDPFASLGDFGALVALWLVSLMITCVSCWEARRSR